MRNSLKILLGLAVAIAPVPLAAEQKYAPALPSAEDAPIAYMLDASTGQVLFARDIDRRFMPASITKVMTTFLAFEWMEQGRLFPEQVITQRPETFKKWHGVGSNMFLPENARVTVDELLHGITTVSANDGAVVLAEGAAGSVANWTAAMNAKAVEIGMHDSHYNTPNGWMDDGRTFVTARDLGTLAEAMITRHPSKYHHFVGAQGLEFNGIRQRNHDPISGVIPGADGIKTGFTNQAGYGFLGSAKRNGRRLIMVVAASPRGRQRNDAARSFIEWGFQAFDTQTLFPAGKTIADARVQNGGIARIGLRAKGPVRIDVPRGTHPKVTLTLRYEGPLQAPVKKNEEVAELVIDIAGMGRHTVPLVADTEVFEATLVQRMFNGLTGWFT